VDRDARYVGLDILAKNHATKEVTLTAIAT